MKKGYYVLISLLIIIILGIGSLIYIKYNDINKFKKLGYNDSQIEVLKNIDETSYEFLTKNYLKDVDKFIKDKNYKKDNLKRYYNFSKDNKISYDKVIYIVNNDYDKVDNFVYNEIIFDLVKEENFDKTHINKYINYYNKNKKLDYKNIIFMVNNNLDEKEIIYSDILPTLINEKYYIESSINEYLDYYNKTKLPTKDVITLVNASRNYDYYTNIKDTDMSKGNLILTNKYNKLRSDYVPEMINLTSNYGNGSLTKDAYDEFVKMVSDMKKEGLNMTVSSSYRSYWTQVYLYNSYVTRDGKAAADRYSSRPGHSEHQTGLTMDVQAHGTGILEFYKYKEFTWMKNNSYKYGFIIRYPEGKEHITGYKYEPWHYRFVGKDAAKVIYDENITFEEYYRYYVLNKKND